MEWYLPVIWAALIGTAVALYVILDGFDLGVGILFPFARDERERDQMMNSIAPFWDGNETWLVLGGGGLWVAFPHAYAIIMPALYLPVIVMLLALVFRGVSFEFRAVANTSKKYWNFAFAAGSTLAAFCQGVILAGLIQGIKVEDGAFAGGPFDWARPFAILCGLGVVAERARWHAKELLVAVLVFMVGVSLWTPLAFPRIAVRWFTAPNIYVLWLVPLVTAVVAVMAWRWLEARREVLPFLASVALFLLGYLGLAISTFPYLVPPTLTVWEAAAAPASQIFLLLGTIFLLPIILGYYGFIYWLFHGKVREGEGYH
jgi:cytochrome d ubiquinol oxidase subunit II